MSSPTLSYTTTLVQCPCGLKLVNVRQDVRPVARTVSAWSVCLSCTSPTSPGPKDASFFLVPGPLPVTAFSSSAHFARGGCCLALLRYIIVTGWLFRLKNVVYVELLLDSEAQLVPAVVIAGWAPCLDEWSRRTFFLRHYRCPTGRFVSWSSYSWAPLTVHIYILSPYISSARMRFVDWKVIMRPSLVAVALSIDEATCYSTSRLAAQTFIKRKKNAHARI